MPSDPAFLLIISRLDGQDRALSEIRTEMGALRVDVTSLITSRAKHEGRAEASGAFGRWAERVVALAIGAGGMLGIKFAQHMPPLPPPPHP